MFLSRRRCGQTFIEYTLMIGILVTVLLAMTPMIRRGIQGMVRVMSDQVGSQENSEQIGGRSGHMINSTTYTETRANMHRGEQTGVVSVSYDPEQSLTYSKTYLNQGFVERNDN